MLSEQVNQMKRQGQLTGIGNLSNLVRVEAIPTLTSTRDNELTHISQIPRHDEASYRRDELSLCMRLVKA